jgi:hypothetical protein
MQSRAALLATLFLLASVASDASIVVVGPLLHEYEVKPGTTYEGSIVLQNPGDLPQEVKVYQTDYTFWADGTAKYGEPPGELPRSNARWITIAPTRATIPPGEHASFAYTIQVPDNLSLVGTFWSVVMVEPVDVSSPESSSPGPKEPSLSVRQVVRYAIQIATSIGATGSVELKFAGFGLDQSGSGRSLQIDLENAGERMYRATVWADVYDEKGQYVGKFEAGQRRLYPGTSARFAADIARIPLANYKALILVDCGDDNVFGANVTLVLKP